MLGTQSLEEMREAEVLAFADDCAETIREAEAGLLRAAYAWAVLHDPSRLDPFASDRPGREKARHYGGSGTPEVCEFAAAELGARIGRTTYAAAQLMADALDLHHRLPVLWARVEAGEVRSSYARHVCGKTRNLSAAEAACVDAGVAESADGRIPWTRFEALVEAKVAQANPEAIREKEERASQATFAKKLRGEANGMGSYLVRADLATIDAIDAAVTAKADALAEVMPDADDDTRRVRAVLLMARPDADPDTPLPDVLPSATLYVHTYAGPDASGIARVEGHGPVTEDWVKSVLGPRCRFTIQLVLDLAGQAPVDAYEIPDRHRQAVHLMTPADTFPFASSLSRKQQVDHTIPFDQGGSTGVGNYGTMTTFHHRIKTHGPGWAVRQPFPGIYLWRDPHGAFYLTDHTGSRRLPGVPDSRPRGRARNVELWRTPVRLELAA